MTNIGNAKLAEPKFTTPCLIRKNTPGLRKKLEALGYRLNNGKWMGKYLATFRIKETKEWRYVASPEWDLQNNPDIGCSIDCGTNEEKFLAIAGLRNDTNKYQWFISPEGCWCYNKGYDDISEVSLKWRKATIEEVVEHFKD